MYVKYEVEQLEKLAVRPVPDWLGMSFGGKRDNTARRSSLSSNTAKSSSSGIFQECWGVFIGCDDIAL